MTIMKKAWLLLLLLGVFTAWSCLKEAEPSDAASGSGSINLRLDSGKAITLQSKATDLQEGLEFTNVLVILVNNSGNVVAKEYVEEDPAVTQDVISFTGLLPGNYQVYAYANINATEWQRVGELISAREQSVGINDSFAAFADRELATLTGSDVPSDPSTSMLLTGHKEVLVGLTTVDETIDLLRPVVRFKVIVRNHTNFPVSVDELQFSHFNPDRAYLIGHPDGSGVPAVPAEVNYRAMPAFGTSAGDVDAVAADTDVLVYQRLIYENAYSSVYKIYATLTLDRSPSMSNLQLSLGDHPFGAIDVHTLNSMDEGEEVDVLVTNPQINPRSGRLFAYIGPQNYLAWESAGYSNFAGYLERAQAIYDESTEYTYPGYNLSSHGYAAWNGVKTDDGIHTPYLKEDNLFDYTGAQAQYYHRLYKSGGLFTLEGLGVSSGSKGTVLATSISGMRLEEGKVVSGKNPPDLGGKLVRFINDSNGKYLQSNTNYDANVPKQQHSTLLWVDGGTHQDRQFMLFGKYKSGGPLKRILKDNNKEVPLTYMARNEEINVVINVYYSDQDAELRFEVDNSTWKDPTSSSHTFN